MFENFSGHILRAVEDRDNHIERFACEKVSREGSRWSKSRGVALGQMLQIHFRIYVMVA